MTELLYMQEFNVESCSAVIESIIETEDGRKDIELDQTCFYARGGGQDWDQGTISKDASVFNVEEVRLDEVGTVHHVGKLKSGSLKPGDVVNCQVDHQRRVTNTRLHSAAHVIDMAIDQLGLDWVATKGQHYPDLSAIEYKGTWDLEKAEELRASIEKLANELVEKGGENSLQFMSVEAMKKLCKYVPENIPKNKPARVVLYAGSYGIPCGGTHVKDIKEVGTIKVPKLRSKKGVIRLSYTVDGVN